MAAAVSQRGTVRDVAVKIGHRIRTWITPRLIKGSEQFVFGRDSGRWVSLRMCFELSITMSRSDGQSRLIISQL
jgi:hypothetical protein